MNFPLLCLCFCEPNHGWKGTGCFPRRLRRGLLGTVLTALFCLSFAVQVGVPCLFYWQKSHHPLWWAMSMSPRARASKTQGRKERWVGITLKGHWVAWCGQGRSAPDARNPAFNRDDLVWAGEMGVLGKSTPVSFRSSKLNCLQPPFDRKRTGSLWK